jgi:fumarate hydratase class II
MDLGKMDGKIGKVIVQVCDEIISGKLADQFPVDVFQTGSGTSTNMNINEVIANRAIQILGGKVGSKNPVHPNDHVNMSQSSNDVIPTAIHIAAVLALRDDLIPALSALHEKLCEKATAFDRILKLGRTHLQDAMPVRLGQEFSGYAAQVKKSIERTKKSMDALRELPLGGTAVGSGINAPPGFAQKAIDYLNKALGANFARAENSFEANAAREGIVEVSGDLKTTAVALSKVANDIRWLASGPQAGLGELLLPPVQPGSSIMPGKVNPVMAEALIMVAAQVISADVAITLGGLGGNFELNTMMPLMAYNLINAITWLAAATRAFTDRCVAGLQADEKCCRAMVERSPILVTALAHVIGYDHAAEIGKEAYRTGRTIREVALEKGILPLEELEKILDPFKMTE